MKIIAAKSFALGDQRSFAELSGDANPMHLDPVCARRTIFGAPVVHGVHLLCWALDNWFSNHAAAPRGLVNLTASFHQGVLLGQAVQAALADDDREFTLEIRRGQTTMAVIHGSLGPAVKYEEMLPPPEQHECRVLDYPMAAQSHGSMPLSFCAAAAARLFPHLSAGLPSFQFAALLATTRLVGMECPGLHSLYSAMNLTFDSAASGAPSMRFRVESADPRFRLLRLAVEGPGFQGRLSAFLRPAPSQQAGCRQLAGMVNHGEFAGQSALVIGGSRGLGEVTAKLLSAGGAKVLITYHLGKQDAEAIAAEINSAGGHCAVAPFDSNQPVNLSAPVLPTHLYYFATPHITADKTKVFSEERFVEYYRCYVTGFVNTLQQFAQGALTIDVLYPSTVFLNEPGQLAEYCAAKAAGEEVCRQLAARFPAWRIRVPRLPRMTTDQNNGFLAVKADAPETVLLPLLRELQASRSNLGRSLASFPVGLDCKAT
jgi:acyl dehydratase